jgi:hypothetical protein
MTDRYLEENIIWFLQSGWLLEGKKIKTSSCVLSEEEGCGQFCIREVLNCPRRKVK